MSLEDWRSGEQGERGRASRLAGSYVAAAAVVAALLGVGVAFGGRIKKQVFEDEVDVKFVPPPPEPVKAAPPPPPPPPPRKAAPPKVASASPAALGEHKDAPPTEIPKARPDEDDPSRAKAESQLGEGDPDGVIGGAGRGGAGPVPSAPVPEAPAPFVAPVLQIAEVSQPPVALSKAMPAYPEGARTQGIEALVIVKFVITETGEVERITIVKGHPLFDDVVLRAVRSWTFRPALLEGKPVRMARMVKIPFRLKAT